MEYTFTLTYRLPESDGNRHDIVERLGAAGCTDALVAPNISREINVLVA